MVFSKMMFSKMMFFEDDVFSKTVFFEDGNSRGWCFSTVFFETMLEPFSPFAQTVAVRGTEIQAINVFELLDAPQCFLAKGSLPLERMQHDTFE